MKKISNILMIASVLMIVQACGGGSEEKSEAPDNKEAEISMTDKTARFEKERKERAEQRRINRLELAANSPTYTDASGELVYIMGEIDPSFIGGNKAMMNYIKSNVTYPEGAEERGDEGTVFVDFVVGKDGAVRGVEITGAESIAVDQSLRNEAIRVVASMPAWTPGSQKGTPVNVKFSIPITFQLK